VPSSARWRTFLLLLGLGAAGCGRTELNPPGPPNPDAPVMADRYESIDRLDAPPDLGQDAPKDLAPDLPGDAPVEQPSDARDAPPACQPAAETCNGVDDDCDGEIDDHIASIPCPNGGERFCVAGRFSDCPRRCEVCLPGSARVCFKSFCTYWGRQECSGDGRSFGPCEESPAPRECAAIAETKMRSRELEQCCLDNNYCCVDDFDLDGDGNRNEMIGQCGAVECTP
jgi:hypothetical protein